MIWREKKLSAQFNIGLSCYRKRKSELIEVRASKYILEKNHQNFLLNYNPQFFPLFQSLKFNAWRSLIKISLFLSESEGPWRNMSLQTGPMPWIWLHRNSSNEWNIQTLSTRTPPSFCKCPWQYFQRWYSLRWFQYDHG